MVGYLVRYLIGTITGAGCAALISHVVLRGTLPSEIKLAQMLALGPILTQLALGFLSAGFLLCYVASTPITIIHAARMLGPHPSRSWLKPSKMWMIWWTLSTIAVIGVSVAVYFGLTDSYARCVLIILLALPAAYVMVAQIAPMLALIEDNPLGCQHAVDCTDDIRLVAGQPT